MDFPHMHEENALHIPKGVLDQMSSPQLRICFLTPDPKRSMLAGPAQVIWEMAAQLLDLGHSVHVVAPDSAQEPVDPRIQLHTFHVPFKGYRWFGGQLWLTKRMVDVVKHLDVDILHAAEYLSTAVSVRRQPRIPSVLTVPGNIYQRLSVPQGNQASFLYTELIKWAARTSARHCAGIISFSNEMMEWWERTGAAAEVLHHIPYGVDTQHFRPAEDARAKLSISHDVLMLLYVGRFDREKGLFDLLEAFKIGSAENSSRMTELHIVGDGPLRQQLEQVVDSMGLEGKIYLHGPSDRATLPLWYSAADALVLPSWIEPFGRVILEAFACATPVIASGTGGPVDMVADGKTGFLFPPRDVRALAKTLGVVMQDPLVLRSMGDAALRQAVENFSWARIVMRIVTEVYMPLLGQVSPAMLPTQAKSTISSIGSK